MKNVMVTTTDNPFDPINQFDEWNAFDEHKQYFTCSFLARLVRDSDQLTDEENEKNIQYSYVHGNGSSFFFVPGRAGY